MRWSELSFERRCRIVESVARRFYSHPLPQFVVWQVVGFGFGWRVRESRGSKVCRRSPALVLIVPRKWPLHKLSTERRIPRFLRVRRTVNGQRVMLNVPIDVRRQGCTARSHSPHLIPGIVPGPPLGTACVMLEEADGKRWLLSCHHVIGNSDVSPTLTPDPEFPLSVESRGIHTRLGTGRRFGPLRRNAGGCVDAALARILSSSSLDSGFWLTYPSGSSSRFHYWRDVRKDPTLLRADTPVRLAPLVIQYDRKMKYHSGAEAIMREVAIFEVVAGSEIPRGGDSGSPIVSRDGLWLGMHIGGGSAFLDGKRRRIALVIPPYVIFDEEKLGTSLHLIP